MKPLICCIAYIAIPDQILALTQDEVTISNKKNQRVIVYKLKSCPALS